MARFLTYHNNILSPYRKITSSLKYGCCHCLKSSMLTGITIPWNRESQLAIWILNFWALPEIKKKYVFSTILAVYFHNKLYFNFTEFLSQIVYFLNMEWEYTLSVSYLFRNLLLILVPNEQENDMATLYWFLVSKK